LASTHFGQVHTARPEALDKQQRRCRKRIMRRRLPAGSVRRGLPGRPANRPRQAKAVAATTCECPRRDSDNVANVPGRAAACEEAVSDGLRSRTDRLLLTRVLISITQTLPLDTEAARLHTAEGNNHLKEFRGSVIGEMSGRTRKLIPRKDDRRC